MTPAPVCIGCKKRPAEIEEYIEMADAEGITPDDFVRSEEGTLNQDNGNFACTECYIRMGAAGMDCTMTQRAGNIFATLFVVVTVAMIVAGPALAFYFGEPAWLALCIPIIFYL